MNELEPEGASRNGASAGEWKDIVKLYQSLGKKRRTTSFLNGLDGLELGGVRADLQTSIEAVVSRTGRACDLGRLLEPLDRRQRLEVLESLFAKLDPVVEVQLDKAEAERSGALADRLAGIDLGAIKRFSEAQYSEPQRAMQYQEDLLQKGSFSIRSPFSGQPVSAAASLLVVTESTQRVRPFPVYFFADQEPFFIYANPLFGRLTGVYFPRRNLLLYMEKGGDGYIVRFLKALIAEFPAETAATLHEPGARRLAVTYGVLDQIGHTILNELEGVHQFAARGLLRQVDVVLKGWTSFVDQKELFPELADKPVYQGKSTGELYEIVVKNRLTVVRPTTNELWFSVGLRQRFAQLGRRVLADLAREPGGAARELADCKPVIWLELKTNRRHWINQNEGFASIVEALRSEYPRLGVILAGWSRFGDAPPRGEDLKMIAQDKALADDIKHRIGGRTPVVDITGVSTREKIGWCFRSDAFVGVQSSGLVFPVGMAALRGVIHASTAFKDFARTKARDGLDYVEEPAKISYIDFDKVSDVGAAAKKWWAQDYDLPWQEIHRLLRDILAARND